MADYEKVAETCILQLYERVRYLNSDNQLKFTVNEKLQLSVTWNAFCKGDTAQRGFESFVRMFQNEPETQRVFAFVRGNSVTQMQNSSKLLFHVTRVFKYIGQVIDHLDDLEAVVPMIRSAGGRHGKSGYNVPSNYFPHLGQAMRQLMSENLKNWNPTVERLWERLYNFIAAQLVTGQQSYGQ